MTIFPPAVSRPFFTAGRAGRDVAGRVTAAKIIVAGGFGVGKTTFVGAVSEITPLRTEAMMAASSVGVDDTRLVPGKTTTTVAMDFGRISIDTTLILYLFGTPGQDRFGFMWDEIFHGAVGAVILADARRLADCFPAIGYVEHHRVPYVVALNPFPGTPHYDWGEVRQALRLPEPVPLVSCDARRRGQVRDTLITLVQHVLHGRRTAHPSPSSYATR